MLDSARLKQILSHVVHIDAHSIHAHVVGEHGDSEVILWSAARVAGMPLRDWPGWSADREVSMAQEVRQAAYEIIRRKGSTTHDWTCNCESAAVPASRRTARADGIARPGRRGGIEERRTLFTNHRRR